ncbi:bZIP transcription factor [Hirsutella rhossiliensis]|uniref:BZIP transcription factor domain-containing protein n=1 Tax=Hirsutella rhossiliensis TaxID=111463 RepID=A0A9P8SFD1_9HYPO|nr:bZIP transcription factor domain-containing protein [Hirsutella rhossiliensis]KAH0958896.1 bZIP transcription factor domain-containing protein [Hirsutella rhossiliensis]
MNEHFRIQAHFNDIRPIRAVGGALRESQLGTSFESGPGFPGQEALHNTTYCFSQSNKGFPWLDDSFIRSLDDQFFIPGDLYVSEDFGSDVHDIDAASCHPGQDSDSKDSASPGSLPAILSPLRKDHGMLSMTTASSQRAHERKGNCPGRNSIEAPYNPTVLQAREKNRMAADKCRSKKQRDVTQLKSMHETLEARHRQLCSTVSDLVAETHALKNMLMQHGNCDCELIQEYLRESASSWIAKKTGDCLEA